MLMPMAGIEHIKREHFTLTLHSWVHTVLGTLVRRVSMLPGAMYSVHFICIKVSYLVLSTHGCFAVSANYQVLIANM